MAITKRTRFEVLRRDNHTCQYCGEKAPDVTLHIDHVMPVALGGTDRPNNLVTACKECNSGKTSIAPDSPLVESVGAEAAAYVLGMQDKMTRFRADIESLDEYVEAFDEVWNGWTRDGKPLGLPADYELSLFRWQQMGVPARLFELAVPRAMEKSRTDTWMGFRDIFSYAAGIIWNMVNAREIDYSVTSETAAVYTEMEMDNIKCDAYEIGWRVGLGKR